MRNIDMERIEVPTIILERGVDYSPEELEPDVFSGGTLSHLPSKTLTRIALQHGFDRWSWAGHEERQEDGSTYGIRVNFTKRI